MISSDFRADARRKLDGKWGKAACITLAYIAIFFVIGFIQGLCSEAMESLISLIVTIIEIPLGFGLIISFVKLFNEEDVKAFEFFNNGFSNFKRAWGVTLQTALKMIIPVILMIVSIFLLSFGIASLAYSVVSGNFSGSLGALPVIGFILFIVSTIWLIVKSYYYKLAFLIAIDNPDMTCKEAVLKSEELMQNRRWKLFCLEFSFIGWAILALFTFGIGYIWLLPYIQFATISFYKNAANGDSTTEPVETNL